MTEYDTSLYQSSINRVIFFLSLLGVMMAIYVLQSFLRQSPIICVSTGCEIVRKNPASYPLGIPVPAFGLIGYSILAISAFLKTTNLKLQASKFVSKIMLGVAVFGVCFVTWFTYTEIFIIKGVCTWCAISAVNMYVIFGLIVKNETNI